MTVVSKEQGSRGRRGRVGPQLGVRSGKRSLEFSSEKCGGLCILLQKIILVATKREQGGLIVSWRGAENVKCKGLKI